MGSLAEFKIRTFELTYKTYFKPLWYCVYVVVVDDDDDDDVMDNVVVLLSTAAVENISHCWSISCLLSTHTTV